MVLRFLTRLGVLLISLAVSSVVVFGFMAVLPGSPARVALGVGATDEAVAAMEKTYGLDQSLPAQYLDWVSGLVRFDLGESYISGAAIGPQVWDRFQVTLWLVVCAIVLALVVAVPLGTLMAVRHRNLSGMLLSAFSQLGVAIPAFLAALLLVAVFAVGLNWLPSGGWTPPAYDPVLFLKQLVLPVISLALVQAAVLARYVRSAVLDVMREDYIRTARAKGLTPMRALTRHGLRNAAIPVVTVLGLQLATLLIGAVVVERVFAIPGLGSGLLDAVAQRDLILVQDIVMLLVAAVLVINFVVDLLYALIDPRLRGAA
ncbi:ABC transporter permease [Demetria terragena]|uniref:ABC transporter permease n=1 Tax=Demetria terragena TaxID=63959 RepID=UPI0003640AB5|nr:ABC transporter permease [Demetria terragena]